MVFWNQLIENTHDIFEKEFHTNSYDKIFASFSLLRRVLVRIGFVCLVVHSPAWWWTMVVQGSWVLVGGGATVCR